LETQEDITDGNADVASKCWPGIAAQPNEGNVLVCNPSQEQD
jgi:hypothetical protein